MDNAAVARILREIADLLEIKDENPFKIRAYRNAADIASNHPHDLSSLDETGLREIPGIGKDLAARIREIATQHQVPIIENKPLAHELFARVDLEAEVPDRLYPQVARVLVRAYALRGRKELRA